MSKICPICNTYEAKHQGALNMHMYHCKIKNVSRETVPEELKECEHDFRLLSVSNHYEKIAYKKGYMEVCKKCQTLH